jgi:hypothetical protein
MPHLNSQDFQAMACHGAGNAVVFPQSHSETVCEEALSKPLRGGADIADSGHNGL